MGGATKTRVMELFGAKLRNVRWSWDGVRADGSIVFIGWKDQAVRDDDGKPVSCRLAKSLVPSDTPGSVERVGHLRAVLAGGRDAFLALATAKDPTARPRAIDAILPVLYRIRLEPRGDEVHGIVTGIEPLAPATASIAPED